MIIGAGCSTTCRRTITAAWTRTASDATRCLCTYTHIQAERPELNYGPVEYVAYISV